jgi:hypothetical protein
LILISWDPLRSQVDPSLHAQPENLKTNCLMCSFGEPPFDRIQKDVLGVPPGDDCAVGKQLVESSEQAKESVELSPRGGSESVFLMGLPRAMRFMAVRTYLQVATPTLPPSVVIDDAKERETTPDITCLKAIQVALPELEFGDCRGIEQHFAIPRQTLIQGAMEEAREEA